MLLDNDPAHAFMPYPPVPVPHAPEGPLAGLTFAAKDLFDVDGYPTSAGSPQMLAMSGIKTRTAPTVQRLLDAGAEFVGKTITDELAFSMSGKNAHFGTPVNGGAPDRIPGGSSSGSAAAVSNRLCDFALGTDTGGSVRAPASHCGLFGIRPTHGRVSLEACHDLAPSFDTCGFLARESEVFVRVGEVLLGPDAELFPERPRLLRARDTFALLERGVRDALAPSLAQIERVLGQAEEVDAAQGGFMTLYWAMRYIQGEEAWRIDGQMIERLKPPLGPGVADRFEFARDVTERQVAEIDGDPERLSGKPCGPSRSRRRPGPAEHAGHRAPSDGKRRGAQRLPQQGAQPSMPVGPVGISPGFDPAGLSRKCAVGDLAFGALRLRSCPRQIGGADFHRFFRGLNNGPHRRVTDTDIQQQIGEKMAHPTVDMETPRVAVASSCVLGEGPVWDHRNDTLLWVDIKDPAIWRYHPGSGKHSRIAAPERVGFVALTHDPDIVIAGFKSGLVRFNLWGGEVQPLVSPEPDKPGNRINDGHVGPDGRLYFGTMDDGETEPTGAFWRWDGKELRALSRRHRHHQWAGLQPGRPDDLHDRYPAAHGSRSEPR